MALYTSGIVTDLSIIIKRDGTSDRAVNDRLRGSQPSTPKSLYLNNTNTENGGGIYTKFDNNTGIDVGMGGGNYINYVFRRAPGFFDVVAFDGNGTNGRAINHNLTVAPQLWIVKSRDSVQWWDYPEWWIGTSVMAVDSAYYDFNFDNTAAQVNNSVWANTLPTASVFYCNGNLVNKTGFKYISYLFATCPGVSKVGSYTGSGTTKQIDCGFTGGARFVLIKRTDSTGDWYVWDSALGIVAGNDPYLLLNSTAAEVTSTDYIDTYSAGFEISSTAPAAINASGGTFIFLAIA